MLWFNDVLFVKCTRVIMGVQVPLLIIDWRGVSIMSRIFPNHGVTHIRVDDV